MIKSNVDHLNLPWTLRPIISADHSGLREVYSDSILSQGPGLYSNVQLQTWASLAFLPEIFDRPLKEGSGWLITHQNTVEAFAVRYPSHRLALLYSRGRSNRKGYGKTLLDQIELDALQEGVDVLSTEASLYSYSLLLRCGWIKKYIESIEIASVKFDRYRMFKILSKNFSK